jgi:hypothetical protein
MYTGEDDTTQLEHDRDSGLGSDMLGGLLARLSPDPSLVDFVTAPAAYTPMCSDQVV